MSNRAFCVCLRRQLDEMHWRVSSAENFSRMRLKLVRNYSFDPHREASALRDNLGKTGRTPPSAGHMVKPLHEAYSGRRSPRHPGVHQPRVNTESLLLEAVKQVKVSGLEDDILELPEDDPSAAASSQ